MTFKKAMEVVLAGLRETWGVEAMERASFKRLACGSCALSKRRVQAVC